MSARYTAARLEPSTVDVSDGRPFLSQLLQSREWRTLTGTQRAVLMSVYARAHQTDSQAWPSNRAIRDEVGCNRRTVQLALRHLEAVGLVTTQARYVRQPDGALRQTSNVYTVLTPSPAAVTPWRSPDRPTGDLQIAQNSSAEPGIEDPPQPPASRGEPRAHRRSTEPGEAEYLALVGVLLETCRVTRDSGPLGVTWLEGAAAGAPSAVQSTIDMLTSRRWEGTQLVRTWTGTRRRTTWTAALMDAARTALGEVDQVDQVPDVDKVDQVDESEPPDRDARVDWLAEAAQARAEDRAAARGLLEAEDLGDKVDQVDESEPPERIALVERIDDADVARGAADRAVPDVPGDVIEADVRLPKPGDQPSPQRMRPELADVLEKGATGARPHDPVDRPRIEPVADPAPAVDPPEQGAAPELGVVDPGSDASDRAHLDVAAQRHADDATGPLLVRLRPPDGHSQIRRHSLEVLDIEGDELATAKAGRPSERQQRRISQPEQPRAADSDHRSELGARQGPPRVAARRPPPPAVLGEDRAHPRAPRRVLYMPLAVQPRDRGDVDPDRARGSSGEQLGGDVAADRLRRRWELRCAHRGRPPREPHRGALVLPPRGVGDAADLHLPNEQIERVDVVERDRGPGD